MRPAAWRRRWPFVIDALHPCVVHVRAFVIKVALAVGRARLIRRQRMDELGHLHYEGVYALGGAELIAEVCLPMRGTRQSDVHSCAKGGARASPGLCRACPSVALASPQRGMHVCVSIRTHVRTMTRSRPSTRMAPALPAVPQ